MKNERTLERIHWPVFLLSFISPTVYYLGLVVFIRLTHSHSQSKSRLGDEDRRLMHLVPAPAVRLMKRRVLSRPGVNRVRLAFVSFVHSSFGSSLLCSALNSLPIVNKVNAGRGERTTGGESGEREPGRMVHRPPFLLVGSFHFRLLLLFRSFALTPLIIREQSEPRTK